MHNSWESIATSIPQTQFEFLDHTWILVQISIRFFKKLDQSDRKYGDTYYIIVEKALQHQHHIPNLDFSLN